MQKKFKTVAMKFDNLNPFAHDSCIFHENRRWLHLRIIDYIISKSMNQSYLKLREEVKIIQKNVILKKSTCMLCTTFPDN
jgi:hypothetical protein